MKASSKIPVRKNNDDFENLSFCVLIVIQCNGTDCYLLPGVLARYDSVPSKSTIIPSFVNISTSFPTVMANNESVSVCMSCNPSNDDVRLCVGEGEVVQLSF